MLGFFKPAIWELGRQGNKERESVVEFEKYLLRASQVIGQDAGELTLDRFFAMNEMITEDNKKNGK